MFAYFRIEHVFLQIDNTILHTDTLLADHDLFFLPEKRKQSSQTMVLLNTIFHSTHFILLFFLCPNILQRYIYKGFPHFLGEGANLKFFKRRGSIFLEGDPHRYYGL